MHPGTIPGTNLSAKFTKVTDAGKKPGVFTPEESAKLLLGVVGGLGENDGGKFFSWKGDEIIW